jgi:tol-pal system protein YbgF
LEWLPMGCTAGSGLPLTWFAAGQIPSYFARNFGSLIDRVPLIWRLAIFRFSLMMVGKKPVLCGLPRTSVLAILAGAACIVSAPLSLGGVDTAVAQSYGRPPGDIGETGDAPFAGEPSDSAQLLVRIGRLESQIRQITGQLEQMQFENHRLEEQLKKFQEDVDFRFHDGAPAAPAAKPPQKRSEAPEAQTFADDAPGAPGAPAPPRPISRGDAFEPSQNPGAPGAPRPLGSPASASRPAAEGSMRRDENAASNIEQNDPGAPLDLSNGRSRTAGGAAAEAAAEPGAPSAPVVTTPGGTVIAGAHNSARLEFDTALAFLKQKSYEDAEKGFAGFLEKNPKNKLASDAVYYLGESYYLRGRQREAAEQYLKLSTRYPESPRAPAALLRLGQSLSALGAKEQACATYGEIDRKYPNAPAMVKAGAEREAKRAQC